MQIVCQNLGLAYGNLKVFENLSFKVDAGTWLLRGANGSGKTSLCRILTGLTKPTSGSVTWHSDKPLERFELLGNIGFCTPNMGLYDELTVLENISFFERVANAKICDAFDVLKFKGKTYSQLSSGWRQRLNILVAFLGDPDFLVLDEPEQHMDEDGLRILVQLIEKRSKLTLISTNNPFGDWPTLLSLGAK